MFNNKNKKKLILGTTLIVFLLIFIILNPVFSTTNNESSGSNNSENLYTSSEYAALFQGVFQYILNNYVDEVDPQILFDGAMSGMFNSLEDPHSTYLTKSQLLDLTDTTEGEFGGLGIHIQKLVVGLNTDSKSKELPYVKIISPIHGTPAYKAGLRSGDYITHINGESTIDLNSDDVLDRLRGKPGTDVTVTILRDRVVSFDETLTRAIIEIPTVKSAVIDNIGYIQLIQFTSHTAENTRKVLKEFVDNNVKGIIFDVRNNPGGLLSSVVDIADLIFSDGVIVSTRSRIESENEIITAGPGQIVPNDIPMAILTNNGSASASEILTGVLKDRDRAVAIGTKTFGKGSVQQPRYFADSGFKMTVARFYSPSGVTIDKLGIEPDILVKETTISDLTEDETMEYIKLLEERTISNFILENRNITDEMIEELTDNILDDGYKIPREFIVYDIRSRANRYQDDPPVYDLVNDEPLKKAIEELSK